MCRTPCAAAAGVSSPFDGLDLRALTNEERDCGVWCPCEDVVDTGKYFGGWALCDLCNSWQHDVCVHSFFQSRPHLLTECMAPVPVTNRRIKRAPGGQVVTGVPGVSGDGGGGGGGASGDGAGAVAAQAPRKRGRSWYARVVSMYKRPDNSLFDHLCPWCNRNQPEMDMVMCMLRMIKKLEVMRQLASGGGGMLGKKSVQLETRFVVVAAGVSPHP